MRGMYSLFYYPAPSVTKVVEISSNFCTTGGYWSLYYYIYPLMPPPTNIPSNPTHTIQ